MSETFADRWLRKQAACGFEDSRTDFVACGSTMLPTDAAPCLNFEQAKQPVPIWKAFGVPEDWSATERERVSAYQMIGMDGAGNPLCVEDGSGAVWLLEHEDWFQTRQYINGSVSQLAECLLANFGEQQPERLRSVIRAIDPAALDERTFWWHEAASLEAEPDRWAGSSTPEGS